MREENPSKRLKITHRDTDNHTERENEMSEPLQVATSFAEFMEDPLLFAPRAEYVDSNYFIEDDTALIAAVKVINTQAVRALLNAGCDPNAANKKGVTPISAAAHKGDTGIMELLIRRGAQVNAVNSSGSTALIQASHFGHLEAVHLLLNSGGTADFANSKGTTALMRASQEGHEEISRVLIKCCADVNKKNHEGMNALMLASQRGHGNVVLELIKSGASMDEQTSQGSTALMLACKRGHEKVVEVLVSMGAEIYMRDCRGRTARDTAVRRHHHHLLQYLSTQVQIRYIQEHVRLERIVLLNEMRKASLNNRLELKHDTAVLHSLHNAICSLPPRPNTSLSCEWDGLAEVASTHFSDSLPGCTNLSKLIAMGGGMDLCRHLAAAIFKCRFPAARPTEMQPPRLGYAGWQWPFILMRCMKLPLGVYELVMEYLPVPRMWQWSLNRLKRRIGLAPHPSTVDVSLILDEMIADMNLFPGRQKAHLVRIARSPAIQQILCKEYHFSIPLVNSVLCWSDVQSLSFRTTETDVLFKQNLAKKYLGLAVALYRQLNISNDPCMLFIASLLADRKRPRLVPSGCFGFADGAVLFDGMLTLMGSEDDGLNEYGIDDSGGAPDQDTETEMPAEGDLMDDGNYRASDDDN
mmetsp:Transcript_1189/g.1931  ORF Transcript_1189/g.1931 Transcript_1189/m.1931 type:complete len:639 (+) Transcript_1189:157-2073(+)